LAFTKRFICSVYCVFHALTPSSRD
jgi:hypothetical protein